jgi:hypothetical protein
VIGTLCDDPESHRRLECSEEIATERYFSDCAF